MNSENVTISSGENDQTGVRPLKESHSSDDGDEMLNISASQEVASLRSDLKREIERYKAEKQLQFQVHIVISKPLDYVEDLEFASQPNSFEMG